MARPPPGILTGGNFPYVNAGFDLNRELEFAQQAETQDYYYPPSMSYATNHQPVVDPSLHNRVSNHSFHARRPTELTIDSNKAQCYNFQQPHANGSFPTPPMTESPTSPRRHSQLSETSNPSHGDVYGSGSFISTGAQHPTAISTLGPRGQQVPPHSGPYPVPGEPMYGGTMFLPQSHPQQRHSMSAFPPQIMDYPTSYPPGHMLPAVASQSHPYLPPSLPSLPSMNFGSGVPNSLLDASQPALRTQRRRKAHVAKACVNCKKAHLSCDDARPCNRCKTTGKEDSCTDVPHKKRGRPRLRDNASSATAEANLSGPFVASSSMTSRNSSSDMPPISRTQSLRTTSRGVENLTLPRPPLNQVVDGFHPRSDDSQNAAFMIAYLTPDLRIHRANEAFRNAILDGRAPQDEHLINMLPANHQDELNAIRIAIEKERKSSDPNPLPPLQDMVKRTIQACEDRHIDRYQEGFVDRSVSWGFVSPSGQVIQNLLCNISLGRTDHFFVVLKIRRMAPVRARRPQSIDASSLQSAYYGARDRRDTQYSSQPSYEGPFNMAPFRSTLPPTSTPVPASTRSSISASITGDPNYTLPPPPVLPYSAQEVQVSSLPPFDQNRTQMYPPLPLQQGLPAITEQPTSTRERPRPAAIGIGGMMLPPPGPLSAPTTPRETPNMQYGPGGPNSYGFPSVQQTPERTPGGESSSEESSRKKRRTMMNMEHMLNDTNN